MGDRSDRNSFVRNSFNRNSFDRTASAGFQPAGLDGASDFIDGPNDDRKWTCTFQDCKYKSKPKANVKAHIIVQHIGARPFVCVHCAKGSWSKLERTHHENTHTMGFHHPSTTQCHLIYYRNKAHKYNNLSNSTYTSTSLSHRCLRLRKPVLSFDEAEAFLRVPLGDSHDLQQKSPSGLRLCARSSRASIRL